MIEYTHQSILKADGDYLKQSVEFVLELTELHALKECRDYLPFALQLAIDDDWNLAFFPLNINMSPVGFAQSPNLVDEHFFIKPDELDITHLPTDGHYNYWLYPMDETGLIYSPWANQENSRIYLETVRRAFFWVM